MKNISLAIAILALIVSLVSALFAASQVSTTAGKITYALSIWTGSDTDGATLWFAGAIPIAHCQTGSYERSKYYCTPSFAR